jgi:hypothetical protein
MSSGVYLHRSTFLQRAHLRNFSHTDPRDLQESPDHGDLLTHEQKPQCQCDELDRRHRYNDELCAGIWEGQSRPPSWWLEVMCSKLLELVKDERVAAYSKLHLSTICRPRDQVRQLYVYICRTSSSELQLPRSKMFARSGLQDLQVAV